MIPDRYSRRVTNRPAATRGWLGQNACIDAAHRVHARIQDVIRTGKDTGLGHFPSRDFAVNAAWLTAAMTGQILLAWLKMLALDGDLASAEPKTLRYRVLHTAARLTCGGRRRQLKIQATWPWPRPSPARGSASPRSRKPPDQPLTVPPAQEGQPRDPWNPGHQARQTRPPTCPAGKSLPETRPRTAQRQPSTPVKDQG
jgi:hypothetical protein